VRRVTKTRATMYTRPRKAQQKPNNPQPQSQNSGKLCGRERKKRGDSTKLRKKSSHHHQRRKPENGHVKGIPASYFRRKKKSILRSSASPQLNRAPRNKIQKGGGITPLATSGQHPLISWHVRITQANKPTSGRGKVIPPPEPSKRSHVTSTELCDDPMPPSRWQPAEYKRSHNKIFSLDGEGEHIICRSNPEESVKQGPSNVIKSPGWSTEVEWFHGKMQFTVKQEATGPRGL